MPSGISITGFLNQNICRFDGWLKALKLFESETETTFEIPKIGTNDGIILNDQQKWNF